MIFTKTLPVLRLVVLVVIILVGVQQVSMSGTDRLEPGEIILAEAEYLDKNNNWPEKPEPIYKDGLKLMSGETVNLKDGSLLMLVWNLVVV